MKTVGVGAALVGVIALAAVAAYSETNGYQWQDFDEYVRSNGAPASHYITRDGDTVYSFIKPCSYAQGFEKTIVTVNSNNKIENISNPQTCS